MDKWYCGSIVFSGAHTWGIRFLSLRYGKGLNNSSDNFEFRSVQILNIEGRNREGLIRMPLS